MDNRDQTIEQLALLAMEGALAEPIDWKSLGVSKDEVYKTMAANVVGQLESIPEENFAAVAMATITKLLVENFVLNLKAKGTSGEQ